MHADRPGRGFTLLELTFVAIVLSLILGLTIPQLQSVMTQVPQQELSYLTRTLRQLRNDAILQNRTYWLVFDLQKSEIIIKEEKGNGREAFPEDHPENTLRPHVIPEDWEITAVLLTQEVRALIQPEEVEILVDSSGFVTPFRYQFRERERPEEIWEVATKGLLGRVEMLNPNAEDS
jgi:type II secretory pathway pseudopilin PulG